MDSNESTLSASVIISVTLALIIGLGGVFWMVRSDSVEEPETTADEEVIDVVEVQAIEEFEIVEREKVEPLPAEEAPPESNRIPDDPFDNFRAAYREHYEKNQRRLLHVTIDRPLYRPGQTIYWQSWHLSPGPLGRDSGDGSDVTVELLDPRGEVVEKKEVTIEEGLVTGSFEMDEEAYSEAMAQPAVVLPEEARAGIEVEVVAGQDNVHDFTF